MLDTDTPSSLKTWIWLHCCIVITSAASSCDDVGVAAEGRAASAAVTNAGFLAIPRYKCGFLGDHFCWFSMITSAGFHPIRDTRSQRVTEVRALPCAELCCLGGHRYYAPLRLPLRCLGLRARLIPRRASAPLDLP